MRIKDFNTEKVQKRFKALSKRKMGSVISVYKKYYPSEVTALLKMRKKQSLIFDILVYEFGCEMERGVI
jgi:hypothetical protein